MGLCFEECKCNVFRKVDSTYVTTQIPSMKQRRFLFLSTLRTKRIEDYAQLDGAVFGFATEALGID